MPIPNVSDISGLITSITASAKIGTCLLVTTAMYFISKRFGLGEWEALPAWSDPVAMILLWWSAVSVLWEAVPRVWKFGFNTTKAVVYRKRAKRACK